MLEITIKQASGKLRLPQSLESLVSDLLASGVRPLALALDHATAVGTLPPLHQDPFDRMLVSQALVEDLLLVTADPQILRYPVRTLDARK